jgi:hypothetical protein
MGALAGAAAMVALASAAASPAAARGHDIDCKVILAMSAGFSAG